MTSHIKGTWKSALLALCAQGEFSTQRAGNAEKLPFDDVIMNLMETLQWYTPIFRQTFAYENYFQVYATIKDSESRDVTVCAGGEREKHIMISDGSELEISIVSHTHRGVSSQPQFIIKYEGKASFQITMGAHLVLVV